MSAQFGTRTPKTPARPTDIRVTRELVAGHRVQVAIIAGCALVSVAATLVLPLVVSALIASVQSGHPVSGATALLVLAGLVSAGGAALATYLLARLGQGLVFSLRTRTVEHTLRMPIAAVRREGTADLATRLTADAMQLKGAVDTVPIQLPMALLTLAGTLVIMGLLDWVLLLITLGGFVAAIVVVVLVTAALRRSYGAVQTDLGAMTQDFVLALESLTVIKTCRAEDQVAASLRQRAERLRMLGNKCARMEALMVPAVNFGQQIALLAVLIGGGARLVTGQLELAAFVAFLLYLLQLTAPLILAASGSAAIQAGLVARARFNQVFATPVEDDRLSAAAAPVTDSGAPAITTVDTYAAADDVERPVGRVSAVTAPVSTSAPALRFQDVEFSYGAGPALAPGAGADDLVLHGLDLTVPARGMTALVGPSGAGKSTVLALAEKLVVPQAGRINVFGRDSASTPVAEIRSLMAHVDQSFTLLAESLRTNLTLGRSGTVADDELWAALDRVGLGEELRSLPEGLGTVLGRGADLSGGQRQRLALARAVLSEAPLVLLDEPSSQLDSRNENRLREIIEELSRDRAVLVVAHRLSTVQNADTVVVLDQGRTVAQGDHHSLDRDCPLYAELVRFQLLGSDLVGAGAR